MESPVTAFTQISDFLEYLGNDFTANEAVAGTLAGLDRNPKFPFLCSRHYADLIKKASEPAALLREILPITDELKKVDGFVDDDGTVWLWLHHGKRVKLDGAGAKAIGAVEGGRYKGWRFPEEWRPGTKNLTLESPKLFKRGGWWYMVSAEGGTGMPLTAHMAIVARSKSPAGPWENSPYNPLVRAKSASEKWWCTGHATLFDDAQGNWWAIYHGYRNSFMTRSFQKLPPFQPHLSYSVYLT